MDTITAKACVFPTARVNARSRLRSTIAGVAVASLAIALASAERAVAQEVGTGASPGSTTNPSPALGSPMPGPMPAPAKPAELEVSREAIQQRLEQSKASKDLAQEKKDEIADLYQKALVELDRADSLVKQTAEFDQRVKDAPAKLETVRRQLAESASKLEINVSSEDSLTQLETRLNEAQSNLTDAQGGLTQLDAEPKKRTERRLTSIPKGLDDAAKQLGELKKTLAAPPPEGDAAELTAARRTLAAARAASKEKEIAALKSERDCYNAEDELLPKQRDLEQRSVAERKAFVDALQEIIRTRREEKATAKLKQAARDRKETCPELKPYAEENEELARRAKAINDSIGAAERQISEFDNALVELKREFEDLKDRYGKLESTPEIGPLLLQYRADLRGSRQQLDQIAAPISLEQLQLDLVNLEQQRKKLKDVPARAAEIIRTLDLSRPHAPTREQLEYELRELLRNRCDLLDSLTTVCSRYFGNLLSLTNVKKELLGEIAEEAEWIDERILWVRSASALSGSDLGAAAECVRWFTQPGAWYAVGRLLGEDLLGHPLMSALAAALFLSLLVGRRTMRARIRDLGNQAARANTDNMAPTLRTLALTILMSIPWPLLLMFLGWRLGEASRSNELAMALAWAIKVTGIVLLPMELIRQICRGRGLGQAHFGWPEPSLKTFRRHLRWLIFAGLPLTFAAAATHALNNDHDRWHDSLGRMLFIVAMLLLAVFVQRVFRACGGMLQEFIASRSEWVERVQYVLFPLSVGVPVALAVLAAVGYFYTAEQLAARLQGTAWLLVGLLIAGCLALRWVLVSRRRLAIRQARQRRAAALAAAQVAESTGAPAAPVAVEEELDLTTINAQTRRLVQAAVAAALLIGLWAVWADVLPALSFLNWELWPTYEGEIRKPVNVSHLLLAFVWFLIMVVSSRNIPGLLEIALLQRLPLEPATRYAITTLSRYGITMLGIVAVCSTLGINWEKVHWLLAAVSVGLGFGLQEIFANFVSGLIILFERPVRVGDIVTVGDVSGIVSKIRIRATMIIDWDRKELIVPNKEFITGRVLNWTLSDQVNRVVINVGVAYGSDAARVRSLLLKIAGENEFIMKEPPPMAGFEGFGDSSLDFVLRCYLPNLENRLAVINDLHTTIHSAFQEEGIEIPFPQRDLNIRYFDASHSQTVLLPSPASQEGAGKRQQKQA